jgi:hypothetical protein
VGRHDITSRTRPVRIRASQRRAEAVRLRLAGCTYREIGERLGIRRQSAAELVATALDELRSETRSDAARLRTLELRRLDELLRAAWPKAMSGDVRAIQTALRVVEGRCLLLGLLPAPEADEVPPPGEAELTPVVRDALGGLPSVVDVLSRNGGNGAPRALEAGDTG